MTQEELEHIETVKVMAEQMPKKPPARPAPFQRTPTITLWTEDDYEISQEELEHIEQVKQMAAQCDKSQHLPQDTSSVIEEEAKNTEAEEIIELDSPTSSKTSGADPEDLAAELIEVEEQVPSTYSSSMTQEELEHIKTVKAMTEQMPKRPQVKPAPLQRTPTITLWTEDDYEISQEELEHIELVKELARRDSLGLHKQQVAEEHREEVDEPSNSSTPTSSADSLVQEELEENESLDKEESSNQLENLSIFSEDPQQEAIEGDENLVDSWSIDQEDGRDERPASPVSILVQKKGTRMI
uniref:Uncharacterized protein n=1 Tax=Ditylenchus dipsaci TaxID=166011 RepID=A0A915CSD9_9BILA